MAISLVGTTTWTPSAWSGFLTVKLTEVSVSTSSGQGERTITLSPEREMSYTFPLEGSECRLDQGNRLWVRDHPDEGSALGHDFYIAEFDERRRHFLDIYLLRPSKYVMFEDRAT